MLFRRLLYCSRRYASNSLKTNDPFESIKNNGIKFEVPDDSLSPPEGRDAVNLDRLLEGELTRDFINDCLYNPKYGYFSSNVNIFQVGRKEGLPFHQLKGIEDFQNLLSGMYRKEWVEKLYQGAGDNISMTISMEDKAGSNSKVSSGGVKADFTGFHQLWHTPAELFKPWFGFSVARYICQTHRTVYSEAKKLVIYEMGPGTGTLANSILDYIRESEPFLYRSMEYHMIEISPFLHKIQEKRFKDSCHAQKVFCYRESIFEFSILEPRECFVLAFEVLDNMPQDRIKYSTDGLAKQCKVALNLTPIQREKARKIASFRGLSFEDLLDKLSPSVSMKYDLYREVFEPIQDPLIIEYLEIRDAYIKSSPKALNFSIWNLPEDYLGEEYCGEWRKEFIPTGWISLFKVLFNKFPKHSLVMSDFIALPDTIPGYNSPVVQTRYNQKTIACSSYLLKRGLFDIFFPTDFFHFNNLYRGYAERYGHEAKVGSTLSHEEFLLTYGGKELCKKCETKSTYNPMLEDYVNNAFFISHPYRQ